MSRFKKLYDTLVQNEELKDMFPESKFTGEWSKDKEKFIAEQTAMEDLSDWQNTDLDFEYEG